MKKLFVLALPLLAVAAAGCDWAPAASSAQPGAGGGGGGAGGSAATSDGQPTAAPPWVEGQEVFVDGIDATSVDCRTQVCRHNENVDMIVHDGATWMVHRTAESQILGDNSSLRVYKSTDLGKTFALTAILPAVVGRDLRDPCFFEVGGEFHIKALTRLPSTEPRDAATDTITMGTASTDGVTWSAFAPIATPMWSFWRIKQQGSKYYAAAYADGDLSVSLFVSDDGLTWTQGANIYDKSEDTPLETELTFMPSGKLLALVRMDGNDNELFGDEGRLRTKICWADPPYDAFDCPSEFDGQRLDGPISFFHDDRFFVIARRHLHDGTMRKRTSLFEITGDYDHGGALDIKVWGDLPSAGDTSYAGYAPVDANHGVTVWYSSDINLDQPWAVAILAASDIWRANLDFSKLE